MNGRQIHPTLIHWIIRLGEMLESYYKLQLKLETAPKFTDALSLIWSALPEKAINNALKDNRN